MVVGTSNLENPVRAGSADEARDQQAYAAKLTELAAG